MFIEKGFITEQEYFSKLKQAQGEYENSLDPQVAIYRDVENGPCEVCMGQNENWEERVVDEVVVFD